jgi:hypothetical protein
MDTVIYEIQLKQKNKAGKVKLKTYKVHTGGTHQSITGIEGGKITEHTATQSKVKNAGKENETSAEEQAIKEVKAKVVKAVKEGYIPAKDSFEDHAPPEVDWSNFDIIPQNINVDKPSMMATLEKKHPDFRTSDDFSYQLKLDGNGTYISKNTTGVIRIYTRSFMQVTENFKKLPFFWDRIIKATDNWENGTVIYNEFTFLFTGKLRERASEPGRFLKSNMSQKSLDKALVELKDEGEFNFHMLQAIAIAGVAVHQVAFSENYKLLQAMKIVSVDSMFVVPELYTEVEDIEAICERNKAEGYIVRYKEAPITISYGGKPNRSSDTFKKKMYKEMDCWISEWTLGHKGEHQDLECRFHIMQYSEDGSIIDRSWVGSGGLDHATIKRHHGKHFVGEVCEVKYSDISSKEGSTALDHPVCLRFRHDKTAEECIWEEV